MAKMFGFNLQLFGGTNETLYAHAISEARAREEWPRIKADANFVGIDRGRAVMKTTPPTTIWSRWEGRSRICYDPSKWISGKTRLLFADSAGQNEKIGTYVDFCKIVDVPRNSFGGYAAIRVIVDGKTDVIDTVLFVKVLNGANEKLIPAVIEEKNYHRGNGSSSASYSSETFDVIWSGGAETARPEWKRGWVDTISQKVKNDGRKWKSGRPIVIQKGYAIGVARFHRWTVGGFEAWTPADGIAQFKCENLAPQNLFASE